MTPLKAFVRPVLTLSKAQFSEACISLGKKIIKIGEPDLVVVVPRAGIFIWNELSIQPDFIGVKAVQLRTQRPFTKHKGKRVVKWILTRLPRKANNFLRHLETTARELKYLFSTSIESRAIDCNKETLNAIIAAEKIVVIDDAIDSGVSIKSIIDFISLNNPLAAVHVAVITTTFRNPAVSADVSLYDRTIIRFPWAEDYANTEN